MPKIVEVDCELDQKSRAPPCQKQASLRNHNYIKGTRAPCASFLMCECACIRVFLFCCCCCAVVLCCCAVVLLFRCSVVRLFHFVLLYCRALVLLFSAVLLCCCSVVLCCLQKRPRSSQLLLLLCTVTSFKVNALDYSTAVWGLNAFR